MNKIKAVVKIIRPINVAITLITVIIAGYFCSLKNSISNSVLLASFSAAMIVAAGNLINDYFDLEIDKINRPTRVLPSQRLTPKTILILYFLLTTIGFILTLYINTNTMFIAIAAILLIFFYSYKLKKIPIVGNIVVSFLTGLTFVYGGVAILNFSGSITPAIFGFLINLIRELVKDIEDIPGDKQIGIITFPIKYGIKYTFKIVKILIVILIFATFFPFIFKLYNIEYFILVMFSVNTLLVYIYKNINRNQLIHLRRNSNLLKLSMIFGLIAIFFGK
jgi:geranylgeranylglycerol-phosphate geranylgeranyltransferase